MAKYGFWQDQLEDQQPAPPASRISPLIPDQKDQQDVPVSFDNHLFFR